MGLFKKAQPAAQPPAAWHPAPDRPGFYRWWDGQRWTDQYHPMSTSQPSAEQPRQQERPDRYQTAEPTGRAVDPWARASVRQGVVGERDYSQSFQNLLKRNRPLRADYGAEMTGLPASVVADPGNRHDSNAVAVWVQGELVGFLPRDAAMLYAPALADLAERGEYLRVEARVWALDDEGDLRGNVNLMLPPPDGVQSFNEPPEEPYQVLPHGGPIQVTGEENHMDVLRLYTADRDRYLAVTLHIVDEVKTPSSSPYRAVEVRLGGQRVGVLTKTMSDKIIDVVDFVSQKGRLPVCRAILKGSPLRAELTLQVAKAHEVTRRWLEAIDDA